MTPPTTAIATPHPDAARAAQLAIQQGGNAIDAAAAALLTLCVVMPQQVGIGGYGGSLILHRAPSPGVVSSADHVSPRHSELPPTRHSERSEESQPLKTKNGDVSLFSSTPAPPSPLATSNSQHATTLCLDFDTVAPRHFHPSLYPDPQLANHGYLATSVPAVIAGLALAIRDHGQLPFSAACQYAADLADRGFPIDATYHKQILQWSTRTDPVSRRALFPDTLPAVGDLWIQRDKAKLLRTLADQGPDAFYHGEIPRTICRQIQSHGGILTEEDFASYQPRYVTPLSISYRGHTILTPPPPSGGLTTLQILKTLEQFDLPNIEPFSPEYFHLFAEATKLCWQDRHATAGDPDFVDMPLPMLLSTEHAAAKAARIRHRLIASSPPERPTGPHTANICVSDPQGNLVSLTATQGYLFGSQVVIDSLGLVLGHGMSRFDFSPPHSPNAPAPGKRPFHNMAPTLVLSPARHPEPLPSRHAEPPPSRHSERSEESQPPDHQSPILAQGREPDSASPDRSRSDLPPPLPRFAVGLPGGPKIVTVTAQLLINLIDFHLSPSDAVTAPRIHVETQDPIAASSTIPDSTLRALEAMGHTTLRGQTVGGPPTEIAGTANALSIDPQTRTPTAASQAAPTAALTF